MKLFFTNELVSSRPWDLTDRWEEALPLGNGRLGAMVFGLVDEEAVQLNEDSLWSGGEQDRNNRDTFLLLPRVRELVRRGEIEEAEKQILPVIAGAPSSMRVYQSMGILHLKFSTASREGYTRILDLEEALCRVEYGPAEQKHNREYFTSFADDLFIMRLRNQGGGLSFTAFLERGAQVNSSGAEEGLVFMDSGAGGLFFAAVLGESHKGGEVFTAGDRLVVRDVSEITLFLDCQTNVRWDDYRDRAFRNVRRARNKDYNALKEAHIREYGKYHQGMNFRLTRDSGQPTSALLENYNENIKEITQLYYNFSRYLLISSSREGTFPANLQGIWCRDMEPPWGSRYTININTQMNYWPADMCRLSACYEPFFRLLEKMYEKGKETARVMYNCRGFVAHHNTNIFGDTAPQDYWISATPWVLGAAWMATHIYPHYTCTRDRKFLEKYFYLIEEAALFFVDFMEKDEEGRYICNPSLSPENSYKLPGGGTGVICRGCSMDSQILSLLMEHYFKALEVLQVRGTYEKEIGDVYRNLPGIVITPEGTIREWHTEVEETDPGHRHLSHLFALFPGDEIRKDEKLRAAAKKTIEKRLEHGGAHTGWSRAWIMNFYAVLHNGGEVLHHFKELLEKSTLPNLLDNHPPFQIDGNFGALTALTMMYVQSLDEEIYLLPACPDILRSGRVEGIMVEGGILVSLYFDTKDRMTAVFLGPGDITRIVHRGREIRQIHLKKYQKLVLEYNITEE